MHDTKEQILRKAAKHEEMARQLRDLALGRYVDNDGNEFAKVNDGVLTFCGKSPKLSYEEFPRFSAWLKKVLTMINAIEGALERNAERR